MLEERQQNPRKQNVDFFDFVLQELQKDGTPLTKEIALDLIFLLLFASYETTSIALTLAIKFLLDHPHVLTQLTVCFLNFDINFVNWITHHWIVPHS